MSKKHYIAIAEVFAKARSKEQDLRDVGVPTKNLQAATCDLIATQLALVMATDNPAFDRARFLAACGVPGHGK